MTRGSQGKCHLFVCVFCVVLFLRQDFSVALRETETYSIDQCGLELRVPPASASPGAGMFPGHQAKMLQFLESCRYTAVTMRRAGVGTGSFRKLILPG